MKTIGRIMLILGAIVYKIELETGIAYIPIKNMTIGQGIIMGLTFAVVAFGLLSLVCREA